MASRDGARGGGRRKSSRERDRDSRSRERARRSARRRERSRATAVEQSGEHEFPPFDGVDDLAVVDGDLEDADGADTGDADADAAERHLDETDGTDAADDVVPADSADEVRRPNRSRTRHRRAVPASHRGRAFADGVSRRLHGIDPKRAVVMALVVSVVAMTLAMPLRTYFSQHTEFQQLAEANEQLRGEVDDFQQRVNEQNDPAYIEAQARERLQFVRPGETPIVMMYPGDTEREAAEQRERALRDAPWYDTLWRSVTEPPRQ